MFCDTEVFSRKVFVGGLPIDITETEVKQTFQKFDFENNFRKKFLFLKIWSFACRLALPFCGFFFCS